MAILEWEGLKSKLGLRRQTEVRERGTGVGVKCDNCGEILMKVDFEGNLFVCSKCDHHHRLDARQRVAVTLDPDSFVEMNADLASRDVLGFTGTKGYTQKLLEAQRSTGMLDAMLSGVGTLAARPVAFGVTDSRFIMGSMGSVVGEKFARMVERAIDDHLPVIAVSGSGGGARMYEGLFSLMQMAKTSAALAHLSEKGLPFISVCTDCTMAGVWASWASLGDVIIAEPKALIGFTGPRVIKTTINAELPPGFQLSEFLVEHGQIDMIVHRSQMRECLIDLLNKLLGPPPQ